MIKRSAMRGERYGSQESIIGNGMHRKQGPSRMKSRGSLPRPCGPSHLPQLLFVLMPCWIASRDNVISPVQSLESQIHSSATLRTAPPFLPLTHRTSPPFVAFTMAGSRAMKTKSFYAPLQPQESSFLNIPSEIRNTIYDAVCEVSTEVTVCYRSKRRIKPLDHPLTGVCRQTRDEFRCV